MTEPCYLLLLPHTFFPIYTHSSLSEEDEQEQARIKKYLACLNCIRMQAHPSGDVPASEGEDLYKGITQGIVVTVF